MKSPRLAPRRRRSPAFEGLESRRLLAVSYGIFAVGATHSAGSLANGPDGQIWFTSQNSVGGGQSIAEIGELNPSTGSVNYFPTPNPTRSLGSLIYGPGGDFWYLEKTSATNAIVSFNPVSHVFAQYPVNFAGANVADLAAGPDGNIWYSDIGTQSIGVFYVTSHSFKEFLLPNLNDSPGPITSGPDGNLWFGVEVSSGDAVGDINPTTHAIVLTTLATGQKVGSITAGTDGNLWFNELTPEAGYIRATAASIDPTTRNVTQYSTIGDDQLATGPDGNIWFTGSFGEIDLSTKAVTFYPGPGASIFVPAYVAGSLVTGPGGRVFVTGEPTGYIYSAELIPPDQSAIAGQVVLNPTGSATTGSPLALQTVFLDLKHDGRLDPGDPVVNTTSLGYYSFTGLAPGNYTVRVVTYPGTVFTSPNSGSQSVTATAGQLATAGVLGILPTGSVLPLAYGPAPFGSHNPDVQTAEVTGLYELIYGRAPDAAGLANWVQALRNGMSVQTAAAYLMNSPEYDTRLIVSYYQNYLAVPNPSGSATSFL